MLLFCFWCLLMLTKMHFGNRNLIWCFILKGTFTTSMQHFTSTLVVTSFKINASSVFAQRRISALDLIEWLQVARDQLNGNDADITSPSKYWWNAVYSVLFLPQTLEYVSTRYSSKLQTCLDKSVKLGEITRFFELKQSLWTSHVKASFC